MMLIVDDVDDLMRFMFSLSSVYRLSLLYSSASGEQLSCFTNPSYFRLLIQLILHPLDSLHGL